MTATAFTYEITEGLYGVDGDAAFYTGSSAVSALVPAAYHCALNGRPYMIDTKNEQFVGPVSIPVLAPQQDNSDQGGASSLSRDGTIPRNFLSWHHGTGQTWHDNSDSDVARFRTSKGVDGWTKNRLSLLPATNVIDTPTSAVHAVAAPGAVNSPFGSMRVYHNSSDTTVRYTHTKPGSGSVSWSTAATNVPVSTWPIPARSVCTSGSTVYYVRGAAGALTSIDLLIAGGTTAALVASPPSGNFYFLNVVKGHVLLGIFNSGVPKVYDCTSGTATSAITFNATIGDLLDVAEAGSYIWLGSASYTVSRIYRLAINETTGAITLDGTVPPLPNGERLRTIFGYSGFILLGTNLGWRCCSVDGTNLTIGPLIEVGQVDCFTAYGRFVYFGWTDFDTTSTGLGRIDLSNFVDTLTPAYASDIMTTAQESVVACFANTNEAATGDTDRVIVQFFTPTKFVETDDGDFVSSGTLSTGYVNFGFTDQKAAVALEVRNEAITAGSISLSIANYVGAAATVIDTINAQGATGQTLTVNNVSGSEHELMATITGSGTTSPALTNLTLLVHPAPKSGQYWVLPLIFAEKLRCLDGQHRIFDIEEELRQLRLMRSPSTLPVLMQIGAGTFSVFIDDFEFHPTHMTNDKRAFNGTCLVKVKELTGVTA